MKSISPRGKAGLGSRWFAAAIAAAVLPAMTSAAPARPRPRAAPKARAAQAPAARRAAPTVSYNRDIRPILSDNCFACHGPDSNSRVAFRLDLRADAVKQGAIVPGNPGKSTLTARINTTDQARIMPPVRSHKTLKPQQKALLTKWIAEGAVYESHWAWLPPRRPAVPVISDTRYPVSGPIDAFVWRELKKRNILPSPVADKRELVRRLFLDLAGTPPTPEDVREFTSDTRPDAYARLVDRLLASPRYGERMATPWLDVVRYADTVGYHGDQNQNAWRYRDWVIDAFNANKPFDQFTIEQIAGDLLPNATPDQKIASAFNRLTMVTREGGAQPKEYLAKYAGDRVRTVGMAWLGSTLGCAECHDHKFDPFTARDFYSMAAYFADIKQWGVYSDYSYTPNPDLKGFNNDYPFPPEIRVSSPYLQKRAGALAARIVDLARDSSAGDPGLAPWKERTANFLSSNPDGWLTPVPTPGVEAGKQKAPLARVEEDGTVVLEGDGNAGLTVKLQPGEFDLAALRLSLLPSSAEGGSIFRSGVEPGTVTMTVDLEPTGEKTRRIAFRHAAANFAEPRYRSGSEILGVHGGWKLGRRHESQEHVALYLPGDPIRLKKDDTLVVTLPKLPAARVRLSVSPLAPADPNATSLAEDQLIPPDRRDPAAVARDYLFSTGQPGPAWSEARRLEAELLECRGGITPVIVTEAWEPAVTRILPRGNWQDETGPVVFPAPPEFLAKPPPGAPRQNRLDLARWLVAPENPLTSRVFVNRLWRLFYGNGLSGQVEDLGAQGEYPSHPDLLDWLAVEFRESGWDVKHMVRLMVNSAVYRQSARVRTDLRVMDPANRLLASQNPRRLEAELVRDNALAIAGLLHHDLGGPPVFPYQPDGYYAPIQFPDREYVASKDERQYRRGVYSHWQRTFLHPMLANFDAPSREDCIAARNQANNPQQALTLLNDPTYVEAARVWAASLLGRKLPDDTARLDAAFHRALARSPKPDERKSLLAFLGRMRESYRGRPEDAAKLMKVGNAPPAAGVDPVELAAWTSLCRVILNLNETITRY